MSICQMTCVDLSNLRKTCAICQIEKWECYLSLGPMCFVEFKKLPSQLSNLALEALPFAGLVVILGTTVYWNWIPGWLIDLFYAIDDCRGHWFVPLRTCFKNCCRRVQLGQIWLGMGCSMKPMQDPPGPSCTSTFTKNGMLSEQDIVNYGVKF